MTPEQLAALKAEIESDVSLRGLSHEDIAKALRKQDRDVPADTLSAGLLVASITSADYQSINAAGKDYLRLIASAGELPITPTLRTNLAALFPAGSDTRANILSALKRQGNRLDELKLPHVTESDVADALRS